MELLLKIALIVPLLVIIYQDFKWRAIYWWLPVLVFIVSFFLSGIYLNVQDIFKNLVSNLLFLLLLLSTVLLYFFIRYKSLKAFTSKQFGMGDVLMLVALCPLLSPVNFIVFMCVSNILMLLLEIVKKLRGRNEDKTIPYAGYLSLFVSLWILLTFLVPNINFLADFTGYFLFSTSP